MHGNSRSIHNYIYAHARKDKGALSTGKIPSICISLLKKYFFPILKKVFHYTQRKIRYRSYRFAQELEELEKLKELEFNTPTYDWQDYRALTPKQSDNSYNFFHFYNSPLPKTPVPRKKIAARARCVKGRNYYIHTGIFLSEKGIITRLREGVHYIWKNDDSDDNRVLKEAASPLSQKRPAQEGTGSLWGKYMSDELKFDGKCDKSKNPATY